MRRQGWFSLPLLVLLLPSEVEMEELVVVKRDRGVLLLMLLLRCNCPTPRVPLLRS